MIETILIIIVILLVVNLAVGIFKKPKIEIKSQLKEIEDSLIKFDSKLEHTEKSIRDEFQRDRIETNEITKINERN